MRSYFTKRLFATPTRPAKSASKTMSANTKTNMPLITPFHLAFPVNSLQTSRAFYGGILGCTEGRSSEKWVDFDLFGHQIVAHCVGPDHRSDGPSNPVDGKNVPVPHFGVVMEWKAFHSLAKRVKDAGVKFEIEPYTRFEGQPGE